VAHERVLAPRLVAVVLAELRERHARPQSEQDGSAHGVALHKYNRNKEKRPSGRFFASDVFHLHRMKE
jgi:hypothetical protein